MHASEKKIENIKYHENIIIINNNKNKIEKIWAKMQRDRNSLTHSFKVKNLWQGEIQRRNESIEI
jgi:hypothetical protein